MGWLADLRVRSSSMAQVWQWNCLGFRGLYLGTFLMCYKSVTQVNNHAVGISCYPMAKAAPLKYSMVIFSATDAEDAVQS
jgi:hypothetical protein